MADADSDPEANNTNLSALFARTRGKDIIQNIVDKLREAITKAEKPAGISLVYKAEPVEIDYIRNDNYSALYKAIGEYPDVVVNIWSSLDEVHVHMKLKGTPTPVTIGDWRD